MGLAAAAFTSSLDQWSESLIKARLGKARLARIPLRVVLWNGRKIELSRKPTVTIALPKPWALRFLLRPSFLSLGAAYIDGHVAIEGPAREAIRMVDAISEKRPTARFWKARRRNLQQDARAVQYHYDVSNDFYRLWLDKNLVYSCAYFRTGQESIDRAQEHKLDHICRKLRLQPGERFLDIGCGWGALIRWAAKHYGTQCIGVTLSAKQFQYAQQTIREERLGSRCQVLLRDYRELRSLGLFDKIASVGMFEHVGLAQLGEYFNAARGLLKEGGLFLNHGICSAATDQANIAGRAGEFIDRYVFPLTELPHMTLAAREMARADFEITDVEALRPHYALTLKHWLGRLENRRKQAERIAGERRYRIWRAYLAGSAHAFERGWISVYQILGIKRMTGGDWPLPWTRDDVYSKSGFLRGNESR